MDVRVGSDAVPAEVITYRGLGHGQPVPPRRTYPVRIRVTLVELRDAVAADFDRFARDMREDDELYNGDDALEPLRDCGYPDFEVALACHIPLVEQVLLEWIHLDLLEGLFGKHDGWMCSYSVNVLTAVSIADGFATLEGEAYAIGPAAG